jgi:hypothetical protein
VRLQVSNDCGEIILIIFFFIIPTDIETEMGHSKQTPDVFTDLPYYLGLTKYNDSPYRDYHICQWNYDISCSMANLLLI